MLTKITIEELDKILAENYKFDTGKGGKKAVLREYDFSGMDLSGKNFSFLDLSSSDFTNANLDGCCFLYADLQKSLFIHSSVVTARFDYAILTRADFYKADITKSDFAHANCCYANLKGAYFDDATLHYANFDLSTLTKSEFSNAECYGAHFKDSILYEAYFLGASGLPPLPSACPETGSFIGYKKSLEGFIIKLKIFESSKRSSSTGRKCRCDKARVLEIQDCNGNKLQTTIAHSEYQPDFVYEVGKIVSVKDFDDNRSNECAPGIHFFITRQEAVDY